MSKDLPDFTEQVQLYAWNGTKLVPVLVDSKGNIVAVMKGIHNTTLKTIKTDIEGRMIGVIRDPTSNRYLAIDANGNITGVIKGEYSGTLKTIATNEQGYMLIKQLPILTFDKKGDVLFHDGFEDGLEVWEQASSGFTSKFSLSYQHKRSGGLAAKILTSVVHTGNSTLDHYMGYHKVSNTGLEVSFSFNHPHSIIKVMLSLEWGIHYYEGAIQYDQEHTKLLYLDNTNNFHDLMLNVRCPQNPGTFSTLKFVVDFLRGEYIRCMINGTPIGMSGIGMWDADPTGVGILSAQLRTDHDDTAGWEYYFDDVIITVDEPET